MEIDLSFYLRVIWRWRWIILLAVGLAAGASWPVVQAMPRVYRTSTFLMVGEDLANPNVTLADRQVTQSAIVSYVNMARRQPVLEATVTALGLPISWRTLQDQVAVVRLEGANLFEIRVIDTSPERVQALANEIARQLVLQSPTLANMQQSETRRQFIQRQLDALQADIQRGEADLAEKQAALEREVSARGVLERQDEIRAIETKLSGWRASYAALLPAAAQTRGPNSLTVVEPAYRPIEPVSPNVPMTVLLAALAGLLLGNGAAFALEFVDDTVRGPEATARLLGLPVVGAIRSIGKRKRLEQYLIAWREPLSPAAEAFRMLRTFAEMTGGREAPVVLLVTSPSLGEGKSFISANLAVSFAQSGRRTVLVDADLRHPSAHRFFGLSNTDGLTSLLAAEQPAGGAGAAPGGQAESGDPFEQRVEAALTATEIPQLRLLTSGPVLPNPAELLASPALARVVAQLRARAEVVIIDSAPVLPVADTTILAARGVKVILVVQAGKTRARAARQALDSLRRADAPAIGIALNRAQTVEFDYHRYPPPVTPAAGRPRGPRLRLIGRG